MAGKPYFHVILQGYEDDPNELFYEAMRDIVRRVRETAPGVLETYYAPNVSAFAGDLTHVRFTKFDSRAAHEAFQVSPIHDEAVKLVVPRMRYAVGDIDFAAVAESESPGEKPAAGLKSYYHFALFREKKPFNAAFVGKLRDLQRRIVREVPGLLEFHFERNISPFGKGWDWVHLSKFTSSKAHDGYQAHDAHGAMVEVLMPEVSDAVAGDVDTTRLV